MNAPKLFLFVSVLLFSTIGILSIVKKKTAEKQFVCEQSVKDDSNVDLSLLVSGQEEVSFRESEEPEDIPVIIEHDDEPEKLHSLFVKGTTCPIVQTIRYKSQVPWKPKKSAWLIDYARHYRTPLDFIYRSMHDGKLYVPSSVSDGVQFNVFRNDPEFRFHLVVSLRSCRMRLYYVLLKEKKVSFLKTYPVCVGKKDSSTASGCLTPLGVYKLGSRVAVFQPRMLGPYKGKKVELIQIFGTHWIPFEKEISGCTDQAKGYGIHGTPMVRDLKSGTLQDQASTIGGYDSDGCIRLVGNEIKELFSVVSMRPTYIEIVESFQQSKLFSGEL